MSPTQKPRKAAKDAKDSRAAAPQSPAARTELLTYAEAAEQLRVCLRTIRNWADAGRLVRVELSHQVQRITADSVETLIAGGIDRAGDYTPPRPASRARRARGE
jgi:excisionase family DNA binding protein